MTDPSPITTAPSTPSPAVDVERRWSVARMAPAGGRAERFNTRDRWFHARSNARDSPAVRLMSRFGLEPADAGKIEHRRHAHSPERCKSFSRTQSQNGAARPPGHHAKAWHATKTTASDIRTDRVIWTDVLPAHAFAQLRQEYAAAPSPGPARHHSALADNALRGRFLVTILDLAQLAGHGG